MSIQKFYYEVKKSMTREERELRLQITQLKTDARTLVSENKLDEAKAKKTEIDNLTEKADILAALEDANTQGTPVGEGEKKDAEELTQNYSNAFFKLFRNKRLDATDRDAIETYDKINNAMSESSEGAGGLLVPQDIQTAINIMKRALPKLETFVDVVPVTTLTGSRVFEAVANMTAFENITDDTADIAEMTAPTFDKITYAIKDYAGWIPIPNDLLQDSDQNIAAYLAQWIAKKSIVTRNTLIIAVLNTLSQVTFADYKAIKKALNVTLDPMIAQGASVITNQDGFQYLDTLEDGSGKPILQVDITQPSRKLFGGKVIEVVSNSVLPTTGTSTKYAPVFVGDPKELVKLFERQGHQIATTNVGGTAFRKNRTEMRVIEREDVKAYDTAAVVRGRIDVTAVLG
jgi:HK97 family phage major capsid protein